MNILKSLISFKKRYNENREPLCQAYAYVGTPKEHLCNRLADSIKFDISERIFEYTGYRLNIDCCMFCTQHTKSIMLKLTNILFLISFTLP